MQKQRHDELVVAQNKVAEEIEAKRALKRKKRAEMLLSRAKKLEELRESNPDLLNQSSKKSKKKTKKQKTPFIMNGSSSKEKKETYVPEVRPDKLQLAYLDNDSNIIYGKVAANEEEPDIVDDSALNSETPDFIPLEDKKPNHILFDDKTTGKTVDSGSFSENKNAFEMDAKSFADYFLAGKNQKRVKYRV